MLKEALVICILTDVENKYGRFPLTLASNPGFLFQLLSRSFGEKKISM